MRQGAGAAADDGGVCSHRRFVIAGVLVMLGVCAALMAWSRRTPPGGEILDVARMSYPERTMATAPGDHDDTSDDAAPDATSAAGGDATPAAPAGPTTEPRPETAHLGQPTLPPETSVVTPPPTEPNRARTLRFGVSTESNGRDAADLAAREAAVGASFDVIGWFADWTEPYPADVIDAITARGSLPMLYWEPWNHTAGAQQPTFTMAAIASGAHDSYLTDWARAAAAHGRDLWLVLAPEMNTRWVPWGVNEVNSAADVVAAWRHVRSVFTAVGAGNVTFVWSPARSSVETASLAQVFPGTSDVDLIGLTLFNGGSALHWGGWLGFEQLYAHTRSELAEVAPAKPIVLTSVGSTDAGGDKAAWVRSMFSVLRTDPQVTALVWFDHDKETNWRMDSSPSSLAVFAEELAAR